MSSDEIEKIFGDFVSAELASAGFVVTAPNVAERVTPGLRQGFYWSTRGSPLAPVLGVSTFWSFAHELDDGPPAVESGAERVSGIYPRGVLETGLNVETISSAFAKVKQTNLLLLNRLSGVASLLAEAERYPGSARFLLGLNELAQDFNRAHCLETVGRNTDALSFYRSHALRLRGNRNPVARAYAIAAQRRVDALSVARATI
jgi:hypothetical protein